MKRRLFTILTLSLLLMLLLLAAVAVALWRTGGVFKAPSGTPKGSMDAASQRYRREEHPARAARFEELTLRMERFRLSGGTLREQDVLKLLGPPDLHFVGADDSVLFTYFYDRNGRRDWECQVFFRPPGEWVERIGWNDATVNDHSSMGPYPSTAPVRGAEVGSR